MLDREQTRGAPNRRPHPLPLTTLARMCSSEVGNPCNPQLLVTNRDTHLASSPQHRDYGAGRPHLTSALALTSHVCPVFALCPCAQMVGWVGGYVPLDSLGRPQSTGGEPPASCRTAAPPRPRMGGVRLAAVCGARVSRVARVRLVCGLCARAQKGESPCASKTAMPTSPTMNTPGEVIFRCVSAPLRLDPVWR